MLDLCEDLRVPGFVKGSQFGMPSVCRFLRQPSGSVTSSEGSKHLFMARVRRLDRSTNRELLVRVGVHDRCSKGGSEQVGWVRAVHRS